MTTSTISRARVRPSAPGTTGLAFGGIVKSEWIKFRSLMSTRILLICTFVAIIGVGTLTALARAEIFREFMKNDGGGPGFTADQADKAMAGSGLDLYNLPGAGLSIGILVLGALAVLFVSSEYATGMIRSTLTAVPNRVPAFAAKAVVLVIVSYALTVLAAFVTFLISVAVLGGIGMTMSLSREGLLPGILLGGLYVAGVALIGLSLGTLLRNSAGGVMLLVALFFVLPVAGEFLGRVPGEFWMHVPEYLPSKAGGRMLATGHIDGIIDPWAGGLIFLAWILAFMIPAVLTLKKRDV